MNIVSFSEILFCVFFIGLIVIGLAILTAVFVNYIFMPLLRCLPGCHQLGERPIPEFDRIQKIDSQQVRLTALDTLIRERQRLAQFHEDRLRELIFSPKTISKQAPPSVEQDYDLDSLMAAVKDRPLVDMRPAQADLYEVEQVFGLARFHGRTPYYLCYKTPTRGGLRTAFAPILSKALRMDRASAERWSGVIPDAVIVPLNSAARLAVTEERKANYVTQ